MMELDRRRLEAILREGLAGMRRLVHGPATLERTLVLTLGGLVIASILVLALSGVGLLRQQAEQQALARVQRCPTGSNPDSCRCSALRS